MISEAIKNQKKNLKKTDQICSMCIELSNNGKQHYDLRLLSLNLSTRTNWRSKCQNIWLQTFWSLLYSSQYYSYFPRIFRPIIFYYFFIISLLNLIINLFAEHLIIIAYKYCSNSFVADRERQWHIHA